MISFTSLWKRIVEVWSAKPQTWFNLYFGLVIPVPERLFLLTYASQAIKFILREKFSLAARLCSTNQHSQFKTWRSFLPKKQTAECCWLIPKQCKFFSGPWPGKCKDSSTFVQKNNIGYLWLLSLHCNNHILYSGMNISLIVFIHTMRIRERKMP